MCCCSLLIVRLHLDVLGVSALIDTINHRHATGATATTVLGPFHVNHDVMMPMWGNISEGQAGAVSFVSGRVLDTEGHPVEGVLMDFWQTDGETGLPQLWLDFIHLYDSARDQTAEPHLRCLRRAARRRL
jgi:protocatechuate 3,4-dioxygenase beta subunit